jgi:hypothetical protein
LDLDCKLLHGYSRATYTRITQSGPRRYLQLVQGYRDENGKAKQRVVASPHCQATCHLV